MFRCDHCGEDFESPRVVDHSYYEPLDYVCPYCGSAEMTEGHYCGGCGEFVEEEKFLLDDYCDNCVEDAVEAMKDYMNSGKQMSEQQRKIFLEYWRCV